MIYLLSLVVALAAAAYYFFVIQKQKKQKDQRGKNVDVDETLSTNSVGLEDITYIVNKLKPESTYLEILLAIASAPESVVFGTKTHERKLKMISDRKAQDEKEAKELAKKNSNSDNATGFNLDDEGWADDDEDDEDKD